MDYILIYKNPTKNLKELYQLELKRTKTKQNEKRLLFLPTNMGRKEAEKPTHLQTAWFSWKSKNDLEGETYSMGNKAKNHGESFLRGRTGP